METLRRSSIVLVALVAMSMLTAGSCESGTGSDSAGTSGGVSLFQAKKPPKGKALGLQPAAPAPAPEPEPAPEPTPEPTPEPAPEPTEPAPEPTPEPEPAPSGSPATFASRTNGVAPLAVFFDAVSTSSPAYNSGVVQPSNSDYGSFTYAWNFGDPDSGIWPTDGRTRNQDSGFTAAHVYENPGTYTATLTVTDASGNVNTYTQEIAVSAFSGTTYYISSSGNDSNNGLSEGSPWRTVARIFQSLASNRRFLFKRGETFPVSSSNVLNVAGQGIIGAYGSGAKPIWSHSGGCPIIMHSPDWRIMDIQITATPGTNDVGTGNSYNVSCVNYLFLRVDISNFRINIMPGFNSELSIHQLIFLADCTSLTPNQYCAIMDGRRLAVIGCTMGDIVTMQHVLRFGMLDKGVISHNRLFTDTGHHSIKMHSTTHGSGLPVTQFVTISDNHLTGGVWTVTLGPQNTLYDERVTQVVVERNLFDTEAATQVGLKIYGQDITVRNNVFIGNGVPGYTGASVEDGGAVPAAARVRFCNNTIYKGDSGSGLVGINISSQVSDVTVQNNLASAPLVSGDSPISGTCPGLVASHNVQSDAAGFTNAGARDFTLTTSSPARNTGTTLVAVRTDYTRTTLRPLGPAADVGAFERD